MGSFRGASGHYGENGGFLREPGGNRDFTTLKNEGEMGVYSGVRQGHSGYFGDKEGSVGDRLTQLLASRHYSSVVTRSVGPQSGPNRLAIRAGSSPFEFRKNAATQAGSGII
ncbi:hypothetical protein D3C75_1154330 [compost metagenome]